MRLREDEIRELERLSDWAYRAAYRINRELLGRTESTENVGAIAEMIRHEQECGSRIRLATIAA